MRFGSVCSGIEAASVAWHPLGWRATWFAEVDKAASAVLAHHFPDVPNLGDMTRIADLVRCGVVEAPDILVGGTPCQDFSIAGLRAGLKGARGQLTLSFVDLADAIDDARDAAESPPCIIVWENVPGVLSQKDNAFGCFLAALAGEDLPFIPAGKRWPNTGCVLGPQRAVAWRVQDAQYHGLAQRRQRVFLVASAREGFDPAAILLEFDGLRRDSPPRRETQEDVTGPLDARADGGGFPGTDGACNGHVVAHRIPGAIDGRGEGPSADRGDDRLVECFGGGRTSGPVDVAACHEARGMKLDFESAVRRLMPVECERLMGFPDNWTRIPVRHYAARRITKTRPEDMWEPDPADGWWLMAADGPRYKQLGNSMAIRCMAWLGGRIARYLALQPYLRLVG